MKTECIYHPRKKGLAYCKRCTGYLCGDCIIKVKETLVCKKCYNDFFQSKEKQKSKHAEKLNQKEKIYSEDALETMDRHELFKLARYCQVEVKDIDKALTLYREIVERFPDTAQAAYAKKQIEHLEPKQEVVPQEDLSNMAPEESTISDEKKDGEKKNIYILVALLAIIILGAVYLIYEKQTGGKRQNSKEARGILRQEMEAIQEDTRSATPRVREPTYEEFIDEGLPRWMQKNDWVSYQEVCESSKEIGIEDFRNVDCSEGSSVTDKSTLLGAIYWAGEVVELYFDKSLNGFTNLKIRVSWLSPRSQYNCGQIIRKRPSEVKDFTHTSLSLRPCD